MSILFIFPPLWKRNFSPMVALPALMGYLNTKKIKCNAIDVNAYLNNYIFSQKFKKRIQKKDVSKILFNTFKIKIKQFGYKDFADFHEKAFSALNMIKNRNIISDKNIYYKYYFIVKLYSDFIFSLYDEIETQCNVDIFEEFKQELKKKFAFEKYEIIGISINDILQYEHSIKLINFIRTFYKKTIFIGGPFITYYTEIIKRDLENGKLLIDFAIIACGEYPIENIYKFITQKNININEIPNLIYKNNNKIYENKISYDIPKDCLNIYNGYDFSQYFIPEPVISIYSSTGCYHSKCKFCDYPFKSKYVQKSVNDIIEQIIYLKKNVGSNKFQFTDACLNPGFISKFADEIIKRKINIYYMACLRFEKNFLNKELMSKLYKSGLRLIEWGLESGSQRISDLYSKNINIEETSKILNISHSVGIYNLIFCIFGFLGETDEEMQETLNYILKNENYIDFILTSEFRLKPGTTILNTLKLNDLTLKEIEELSNRNLSERKNKIEEIKKQLPHKYIINSRIPIDAPRFLYCVYNSR